VLHTLRRSGGEVVSLVQVGQLLECFAPLRLGLNQHARSVYVVAVQIRCDERDDAGARFHCLMELLARLKSMGLSGHKATSAGRNRPHPSSAQARRDGMEPRKRMYREGVRSTALLTDHVVPGS
jgi:hypothetical protein